MGCAYGLPSSRDFGHLPKLLRRFVVDDAKVSRSQLFADRQ
ncbi:hypothetical protein [Burkholderia phage BCSR5]|nr:hypothetical protein [Burkholderia phage BCSR5]